MARRIITGNDNDSRSRVVSDGAALEFGTLTEFWATESSPADYCSDDEVAGRRVKLEPPGSGTIFRFSGGQPLATGPNPPVRA